MRAAASRRAKESSARAEYGPKGVRPTAHSRLGSLALRAAFHATSWVGVRVVRVRVRVRIRVRVRVRFRVWVGTDGATPQPLCSSAPGEG